MSFVESLRGRDRELTGIAMPRPSDFHAHFRKSPMLDAVLPHQISWVKYALAMPNTQPITTLREAEEYWEQLKAAAAKHGQGSVEFVMTLYYTARVTPQVVEHFSELPFKLGVKAYPPHKGATTGSGAGVPILSLPETLRSMEVNGGRLLIHGESVYDKNGNELPHEEREGEFMREVFRPLRDTHPDLPICLEHISTIEGIEAVKSDDSGNTVCTITPHHAICSTEDFSHSWANHLRCMPIPKAPHHRDAIREFMTGGDKRVILGTDTAPHPSVSKVGKDGSLPFDEAACGCYLPHAIAMYAQVFTEMGALDERFAKFACFNGPDWWNLPRPSASDRIHIRVEHEHDIPEPTPVPEIDDIVIPLGWTREPDRMRIGLAHVLQSEHAH